MGTALGSESHLQACARLSSLQVGVVTCSNILPCWTVLSVTRSCLAMDSDCLKAWLPSALFFFATAHLYPIMPYSALPGPALPCPAPPRPAPPRPAPPRSARACPVLPSPALPKTCSWSTGDCKLTTWGDPTALHSSPQPAGLLPRSGSQTASRHGGDDKRLVRESSCQSCFIISSFKPLK